MAWLMLRPPRTRSSAASSSSAESLPEGSSTGRKMSSGPSPAATVPRWLRERIRLWFPSMVLISPLWHSIRKGWARSHVGRVLVLKRWWKTASGAQKRGSARSV